MSIFVEFRESNSGWYVGKRRIDGGGALAYVPAEIAATLGLAPRAHVFRREPTKDAVEALLKDFGEAQSAYLMRSSETSHDQGNWW